MKILLEFTSIEAIGHKRTRFKSARQLAPKAEVALDNNRIYAIYDEGERLLVVYETDNIDFYRYYVAELGTKPSGKQLEKLSIQVPRCPFCGAVAEVDADEMFCPKCGASDFWNYEEEIVWKPKQFSWDEIAQIEPIRDPEEVKEITSHNAVAYLKAVLEKHGIKYREVMTGHIMIAGSSMVKEVKEKKRINENIRIVLGFWYESHYDEIPVASKPGIYAVLEYREPSIGTGVVAALLDKELDPQDIRDFLAEYPCEAYKLLPRDKLAEVARGLDEKTLYKILRMLRTDALDIIDREKARQVLEANLRDYVSSLNFNVKLLQELGLVDKAFSVIENIINIELSSAKMEIHRIDELLERAKKLVSIDTSLSSRLSKLEFSYRQGLRRKLRRTVEEIIKKLPDWADAAVVCGLVYPAKRSRYGDGFYYSTSWKPIEVDTTVFYKLLRPPVIVFRNRAFIEAEKLENSQKKTKYTVVKPRATSRSSQPMSLSL